MQINLNNINVEKKSQRKTLDQNVRPISNNPKQRSDNKSNAPAGGNKA